MLTDKQKQEYIQGGAVKCPYCGSIEIGGEKFGAEAGEAWQAMDCADCGKRWRDIYKLAEIEESEEK